MFKNSYVSIFIEDWQVCFSKFLSFFLAHITYLFMLVCASLGVSESRMNTYTYKQPQTLH